MTRLRIYYEELGPQWPTRWLGPARGTSVRASPMLTVMVALAPQPTVALTDMLPTFDREATPKI
jgi:hypothetical protein